MTNFGHSSVKIGPADPIPKYDWPHKSAGSYLYQSWQSEVDQRADVYYYISDLVTQDKSFDLSLCTCPFLA